MSRYVIPDRPDGFTPEREIIVGWDPPLGTFFAQEYGPEIDGEDNLEWWIGYAPREVQTIAELRAQLLARGVVIPQDVDDALRADEAAPWEPGPLQRMLGFTGKEMDA